MQIKNLPTPELLKQIGKDARSYVIFILAGLIWYFVFRFTGVSAQVNANCENEKIELRKELSAERLRNQQMTDKEQQRSDSIQREMAHQLDSLLHERFQDKIDNRIK